MKSKILLGLCLMAFPTIGFAKACNKQLKVAVIDTGLDLKDYRLKKNLCKIGHKNFVSGETIADNHGHGTHVVGLIETYAVEANYCILIYKYYQEDAPDRANYEREVLAIKEAIFNGANIINFSGGGISFGEEESLIIKNNPQVTFIVAAGNDSKNLDDGHFYYPASLFYKNMVVVGALESEGHRTETSNYSDRIKAYELGENVFSYLPNNTAGYMTGTSMATAIHTGKVVANYKKVCHSK